MAGKRQEENSSDFTATGAVPARLLREAKSLESLDERHRGFRGFRIRPRSQEMQWKSEGRLTDADTARSRQSKARASQLDWVSNKPSQMETEELLVLSAILEAANERNACINKYPAELRTL